MMIRGLSSGLRRERCYFLVKIFKLRCGRDKWEEAGEIVMVDYPFAPDHWWEGMATFGRRRCQGQMLSWPRKTLMVVCFQAKCLDKCRYGEKGRDSEKPIRYGF